LRKAQALPGKVDARGVVNGAVEDDVSECGSPDQVMLAIDGTWLVMMSEPLSRSSLTVCCTPL
jgi:hypothetical protein